MLRTQAAARTLVCAVVFAVGASVNLHSAEIRVGNGDLAVQMTRMREWLDSRRFEPAIFRYEHIDGVGHHPCGFLARGASRRLRPRIPRQDRALTAAPSVSIPLLFVRKCAALLLEA